MVARILAICLLSALSACAASVPMASPQEEAAGKAFAPPAAGQAALYVFRTNQAGATATLTAGARPLGTLTRNSWLRVALAPGRYDVRCAMPVVSDSVASLEVDLAAGETRYVSAALQVSGLTCRLAMVDADTARLAIMAGSRAKEIN